MPNQSITPSVEMATSIDFLGCELIAAFRRDDATKTTTAVAKQTNAGGQAEGISLLELADRLVEAVAALFPEQTITIPKPEIQLPKALENIAANYRAYVNEFMLKVEKADGKEAEVEYAFWIGIGLDQTALEALKKEPPFNILMVKDLYIKIWNTRNEAILKEMKFADTSAILGTPALPPPPSS